MSHVIKTSENIKRLSDEYSKGKVEIKYKIQVPLIPNKERKRIEFIVGSITFVLMFALIPISLGKFLPKLESLFAMFLPIPFLLVFFKKYLFQVKDVGLVRFLGESINLEIDNEIETIYYSEIKGIYYKYNVLKSVINKNPEPKTLIVEFGRYNKRHIFIEVANDLFLTKSDMLEFKRLALPLEEILNCISSKFGTKMKQKLKVPIELENAKGHNL